MQQQIFADGIGKISVIGGVVRLDFMVYAPVDGDGHGQPRQTITHQVLMGVEAFTRASAQCADAVKQLQASNQTAAAPKVPAPVPKMAAPAPEPAAAPAVAAPVPSPRPAEASPWTANFKPIAPMRPFP